MIEYAILIVMVIFAGGFAWLWLIEQKREKRRVGKRKLSDDEIKVAKAEFESLCALFYPAGL